MLARLAWFLAFALLPLASPAHADEPAGSKSPRLLVHLLDYLAKDYAGAVTADGKVISESEYKEQQEFSASAGEASRGISELQTHPEIGAGVGELQALIARKAPPSDVAKLARSLQQQVIAATHLEVAPTRWPSLARGKELFAENCVSCHGATGAGDGPAGASLDPKPANFLDEGRIGDVSPLQAFNTIRLGVQGTGMPPFPALSDEEAWSVAFHVISLRHGASGAAIGGDFGDAELTLAATSSDADLKGKLDPARLDALRLHSGSDSSPTAALDVAHSLLAEALVAYKAGDSDAAKTQALKAYLEGIEPVEPRIRATDPDAVSLTETRMAAVRGAIEARQQPEQVEAAVQAAAAQVDVLKSMLQHKDLSPTVAFTASSAILLREGFEAVLLILALLGVIRAAGSRRAALWVHAGWIAALACGGVAWVFSGFLLRISGAQREMLEAWTSLFAVAVLLLVGFWLHSRTEIGRWNHFLKVKVRGALNDKNLFALASISFIAVFREAIETVLFLRAIWLEGGQSAKMAMASGVLGTLVVIILGAWAVLRYSARVPVRKLFAVSAVIMAALAFILTGKGLHSLQETGALGVTTTQLPVHWEFFGVYPTWQTFAPQLAVALLCAVLWVYGRRPSARPVRAS